jgi:alkanesulfonate monooxygenase SsuD/methylene tetrahydromethanopterin reductase-like flavin-dependent oxidoreductase (luciferase family)
MAEEFDFGFTAVDEEELGLAATPPTPPAPSVSPDAMAAIAAQIADLRNAVSAIKPATSAQVVNEVEERANATREECKEKLQAVERLILPLLTNLMKNPEKSYIKWEGRAEKITAQIDKITAITRSYGV